MLWPVCMSKIFSTAGLQYVGLYEICVCLYVGFHCTSHPNIQCLYDIMEDFTRRQSDPTSVLLVEWDRTQAGRLVLHLKARSKAQGIVEDSGITSLSSQLGSLGGWTIFPYR